MSPRLPLAWLATAGLALSAAVVLAAETPEFPISAAEQSVVDLVDERRYVKARELAEQILAANPSSFVALWALAEVHEEGEGNLPKARFYSQRARQALETHWGTIISNTGPWRWHARILRQLIVITKELDRQEEAVELLEFRNELYRPLLHLEYGWPLMKLGRFEEAREKLGYALASGDQTVRLGALNTLGAMEDELDNPEESYRIFTTLVKEVQDGKLEMDVAFLRNAGSAAWSLGKLDEAERLLLEATKHFDPATYSNPWEDLTTLYIGQGRFPEALATTREMHAWQHACQPAMEQQRWAGTVVTTAALFLEVGFTEEALRLLRQALARPDRRAGTSVHSDQSEAGNLVVLHHALALERERLAERRSWSDPWSSAVLWLASQRLGIEQMVARRRAAALVVGNRRITSSLRAVAPDSIAIPDWIRPELTGVLGPGVVGAVAARLVARTDARAVRERPWEQLILGESLLARGAARQARAVLDQAAAGLPRAEVLLRARCAALGGLAAERTGDRAAAARHFLDAYQRHPGVLRSVRVRLPVRVAATGGETARLAASWLTDSPRLANRGYGFTVQVSESAGGLAATLGGPDGAILREVRVASSLDPKATARALCEAFHRQAFAPQLDLAQTDIASLEGSTLSGDAMREQVKELLGQ